MALVKQTLQAKERQKARLQGKVNLESIISYSNSVNVIICFRNDS